MSGASQARGADVFWTIPRAIETLADLAKRKGVKLRQSYLRLAKRAASMVGAIMRISSGAPGESSNSCEPVLAASFATSAARSRAIPHSRTALAHCSMTVRYAPRDEDRWRRTSDHSGLGDTVQCAGAAGLLDGKSPGQPSKLNDVQRLS